MIEFEHTEVVGWEAAIRGMRNPHNSWDKSDSYPAVDCGKCGRADREEGCRKEDRDCTNFRCYEVGPNDHNLMMRLVKAGTDHRKFMRMIVVYVDVTAPRYWWAEADTYKVGTVANSCSTMHKIHAKELTPDDFSHEFFFGEEELVLERILYQLNYCREKFNATGNKNWWWKIIQLLPQSYNQRRTLMLNYEVLANIYHARKGHKLIEWRHFCRWIESLPYSELITGEEKLND